MNKPEAELSGYQKERIIPIEFQNDQEDQELNHSLPVRRNEREGGLNPDIKKGLPIESPLLFIEIN